MYHLPWPLIVWVLQKHEMPKEIIQVIVLKHLDVTVGPVIDSFSVWQRGIQIPLTYSDSVGTNGDVLVSNNFLVGYTDGSGQKTVIDQESGGNASLHDAIDHALTLATRCVPSNNVRRTMEVGGEEIYFFEHVI
jgi:hypothetical protein